LVGTSHRPRGSCHAGSRKLDLNVGGCGCGGDAEGAVLGRAGAFAEAGECRSLVGEQLGGLGELDDAARVQNEDAVRVDDGVEAVCDGQSRPVREVLAQHLQRDG
jgi:hypothetical protein